MDKKFYSEIYEMIDEALDALLLYESGKDKNAEVFKKIRSISVPCMEMGHEKASIMNDIPAKEQGDFQRAIRALPMVSSLQMAPHKNPEVRKYLDLLKNIIGGLLTAKVDVVPIKIFYSWQSTLPNNTNRSFIADCLNNAVKAINSDSKVDSMVVIDSDTKGIPGSPDIINAILAKIDNSFIFVADVSLVNGNQPNMNVMFELGYALKALGSERIVMIFNEAYGSMADLPFDLGFKRQTLYKVGSEDISKSSEKAALTGKLNGALRLIIDNHY
jgi:hypothetical protein